jgi:hypothetical protein
VGGKTTQKTFKITVASRDNQTADIIIEFLKSKIIPTEIKVGIRSVKTLGTGECKYKQAASRRRRH